MKLRARSVLQPMRAFDHDAIDRLTRDRKARSSSHA